MVTFLMTTESRACSEPLSAEASLTQSENSAHHSPVKTGAASQDLFGVFEEAKEEMAAGFFAKADDLFVYADLTADSQEASIPHTVQITIKSQRAHLLEIMGRNLEAIQLYRRCTELADLHGDRLNRANAIIHNNLAALYKQEGFFDCAEYHYKTALLLFEMIDGAFSDTAATLYRNLGNLYLELHHPRWAVRLFKRELRIQEKLHPQDDSAPEVQQALLHLGAAQLAMGAADDSSETLRRVPHEKAGKLRDLVA